MFLYPFLFIRGLSCPRTVQTVLTGNCLKLTYTWISFLYLVVTLAFLKSIGQVLAWKSGRKVPLVPLGLAADTNDRLAHLFLNLKPAKQPL